MFRKRLHEDNKKDVEKRLSNDIQNTDKILFCDDFDEGIGSCGGERSSSPSESTLSIDELDNEDFLIGLDNFFDEL